MLKYRATYLVYDRHYHVHTDKLTKEFVTVQEALDYQYRNKVDGFDLMIEEIVVSETGEKVKPWQHTAPGSVYVEV